MPCRHGLPSDVDPAGAIDGDAGAFRPRGQRERDVHDALNLDEGIVHLPVYGALRLPTEPVVLAEEEETRVILDENGIRKRVLKQRMSMPQFIEFPVSGRRAWEELRAGLDTSFAARTPADWPDLVASLHRRTFPIALGGYPEGLFGELRQLMGAERLLFTFHDDPGLIHDILHALTELWLGLWEEALAQIEVDCVHFWEDMCFRSGPLISPAMFRQFLMPCYRRLTGFLRARGIDIILVDTDGDCNLLIPLFLEAGVTGLYPMEVQAGMDVVAVARRYARLQILGGIAKQALAQGREAIDRELAARLPYMLQRGGYIPTVDHHVPPDVSWDSFSYYRRRVAEYYAGVSPTAGRAAGDRSSRMSSMSPRERILRAMRRQRSPDAVPGKPDRVPCEASFTQPLYETFVERTGQTDPALYFGMDRRDVGFLAPRPQADLRRYLPPDHRAGEMDEWGNLLVHGFKYDTTDYVYPMRGLRTVAELAEFPLADFTQEHCHAHLEAEVCAIQTEGYAVTGSLWGTLFERSWHLRGMDNLFADFHDDAEFAAALLDRMTALRVFQATRYAEAGVDILHVGDDIGMQDRIMMSTATWRRWFKPRLAAIIAAARRVKHDLLVEYHSDGYIEPFIPELIEIGMDVLNPVQPECMDPAAIKRKYGDRLAFSGTIGTQTTMPFGTAQEVRRVVQERIATVGKDGGLVLAPTHILEPDVPWENVLALFAAAAESAYRGG